MALDSRPKNKESEKKNDSERKRKRVGFLSRENGTHVGEPSVLTRGNKSTTKAHSKTKNVIVFDSDSQYESDCDFDSDESLDSEGELEDVKKPRRATRPNLRPPTNLPAIPSSPSGFRDEGVNRRSWKHGKHTNPPKRRPRQLSWLK